MNSLSNEQKEFIINLSNEMNTQDTRCTASPYGLLLMEENTRVIPEGYGGECFAYWNESEYDCIDELKQDIKEYYEYESESFNDDEMSSHVFGVLECNTLESLEHDFDASQLEISIHYVIKEQEIKPMSANFFLTEKGYEDYLRRNRHNLNKPSSWGIHLYRNTEIEKLYEIIHILAKDLK